MKPSQEYLKFLDEFLECRDNRRLNLLKNQLQEVVHRESARASKGFFIERYSRAIAAIHIHGRITLAPSGNRRINFCATLQHRISAVRTPAQKFDPLRCFGAGPDKVEMSVLVDIRENDKKAQSIINRANTVVRLQTLDECKRLVGNPRKFADKFSFGKWASATLGKFNFHRELSLFAPIGFNGGNVRITLDQLESQMVERRPHLINRLSCQQRNLKRRRLGDIQLFLMLRLRDNFVRLTSGILGNATLDSADVFLGPIEFQQGRLEAIA